MSRDPKYQHLLNSVQWKRLRATYLQQHPLCERCLREGKAAGIPHGFVTSAVDVHHKKPVESGSLLEMEALCFNPDNLEALCVPCHIKTHQEMRSHCTEEVKVNKEKARQRFLEQNDPNYGITEWYG